LKSCCVLKDHYDDERNKTVFHNTTSDLQDQDVFLVSDRSCPKTDGLGPHHYLSTRYALFTAPDATQLS